MAGGPRGRGEGRLRVRDRLVPPFRGAGGGRSARPRAPRGRARRGSVRPAGHAGAGRRPRGGVDVPARGRVPGGRRRRGERSARPVARPGTDARRSARPAAAGRRRPPLRRRTHRRRGGAVRQGGSAGVRFGRGAASAGSPHPRPRRPGRQPAGPDLSTSAARAAHGERRCRRGRGWGAGPAIAPHARVRERRGARAGGVPRGRAGAGLAERAAGRGAAVPRVRCGAAQLDLRTKGACSGRGPSPRGARFASRGARLEPCGVALHPGPSGGPESRLRGGRGLAGSSVGARAPGRGRPPGPARRSARPWAARAWARPPPRRPPRPGLAVTAVSLFGPTFQHSVLLASGPAAFRRQVRGVIDLDALGGIVTKAVTPEPRQGNPPPRVAEFAGGMLNSVGLANPGLAAARTRELPWLAANLRRARVLVNVAGGSVDDYVSVIEGLTDLAVISAFEINASCPNTDAGGLEFGATPDGLRGLVRRCRRATARPIVVKLSPVAPDLAALARVAQDEG